MGDEIKELETTQQNLSSQLSSLETEISSLRSQLPTLELQKARYSSVNNSVRSLESDCASLRTGAKDLSSRLLKDREVLVRARARIDRIASDLRSVEYTKTRRQITNSLTEILQDLCAIWTINAANAKSLGQATAIVRQIEARTPKMLMILEKSR